MRNYISTILIILLMFVYAIGCFQYIMPQQSIPYIVRIITIIGPLFVLIGMLRIRFKRIREYRTGQKRK